MAANKWMTRLAKHDTARQWDYNPFMHIQRFSSPGINFTFGKTHGQPNGFPMIIYGPEKSGKTILVYDRIAELHKSDPSAIAVRFDTEMRDECQLTPQQAKAYGIDIDRYQPYIGNAPENIFDFIEKEVDAMITEGAPIKLIIIDSLTNIKGRKMANAESVTQNVMGDEAATQQTGLKRIWDIIHKHRIGFIVTCQVRAEFDQYEKMRNGVDYKMAGGWFLKHFGAYVMHVAPILGAKGASDMNGEVLEDATKKDGVGKSEKTAHRIRVKMVGNSFGPKGRATEVTFSYNKGFINHYEEAFILGEARGIVQRPNNRTYILPDFPTVGKESKWSSKDDFIKALQEVSPGVQSPAFNAIVERLRGQDIDLMENGERSAFFREEETKDQPELEESAE
jgi:RecA/RadA recombinase